MLATDALARPPPYNEDGPASGAPSRFDARRAPFTRRRDAEQPSGARDGTRVRQQPERGR